MTHAEALLALDGVDAGYPGTPVVHGIDLAVHAGTFLGLVGPSGAGKTTLLRVLTGSLAPSAGTVRRRAGVRVGYVPQVQSVDWTFPLRVVDCVLLARTALQWRPRTGAADRAEALTLLDRLGIADLAHRHIRELSGGQQQRMFLARALLGRPDVVLADEPTSGVDLPTRHEVMHLLADLHADGLAIVLTTHDLNGVAAHLPTLACLRGSIVAHGSPTEVLRPDVLEQTYGAPLDVLTHAGVPVVVDHPLHGTRGGHGHG